MPVGPQEGLFGPRRAGLCVDAGGGSHFGY